MSKVKGKDHELNFWKHWLPHNYHRYSLDKPLNPVLVGLIGDKKEVNILDVGSGPISTIGYKVPGVRVNIVFSDVLANEYVLLLKQLGIEQKQPLEYQNMYKISYSDDTFDIVNCRNALDHSQEPYQAIQEMKRVCKPGGWVYLFHFRDEGNRSKYTGMHQWNMNIEENIGIIFNKETKYTLNEFETTSFRGRRRTYIESKYHKV